MGFGGFGLGGKPQNATKNPFGVSQEGFSSSTTSSGIREKLTPATSQALSVLYRDT